MGAQTQHKARPQVGLPKAMQGTSASWAPQRTSATQTQGTSARPQVGRPNVTQCTSASWAPQRTSVTQTQGTSARWVPKRNTKHVRKLGAPMHVRNVNARHVRTSASWAPQCNASHVRKLGAPMQCKARPQVGRPNARPQRKARLYICKLGVPTQHKARPQDGRPNAKLIHNENIHTREYWDKRRAGGWIRTNFVLEVEFLIRPHQGWVPQRNARHVHKMGAQTQHKARPQVGCPNAMQGTSTSWAPQRTSATQTQGTSTTQT
jgi:hypothetical protein